MRTPLRSGYSFRMITFLVTLSLFAFCIDLMYIDAFQLAFHSQRQTKIDQRPCMSRQTLTTMHMVSPALRDKNNGANQSTNGEIVAEIESVEKIPQDLQVPSSTVALAAAGAISTPNDPITRTLPTNWLGERGYILSTAALIGLATGTNIAVFKKAVECVREIMYGDGIEIPTWLHSAAVDGEHYFLKFSETIPFPLAPAVGGLIVGILLKLGGDMPPGLRDTVTEVDLDAIRAINASPPQSLVACTKNLQPLPQRNDFSRFSRKAIGATVTLGTGNSLGPEGPSVEAGMSLSRLLMNNEIFAKLNWVFGTMEDSTMTEVQRVNRKLARDRLLLACGAAAGVSAGFNAPLSGVFFALEIVQNAFVTIDFPLDKKEAWDDDAEFDEMNDGDMEEADGVQSFATIGGEALASQQINISAILLASVVSALTIQLLIGSELSLRLGTFDLKNPLLELPLYLLLGAMSGVVAAIFSGFAQYSKSVFDGEEGPLIIQDVFRSMPKYAKPLIASLFCGIVGIFIPQVLFFGYETLNGLFLNNVLPTEYLFLLLMAKLMTTAISASSGLVGGTFAPSLFLGGVLGAGFHNVASGVIETIARTDPDLASYPIVQGISGLPAFAMVGAASVLAALFRAPLTASLLLFECTRNYDVILPLMASAGVASLTGDIVEKWLDEEQREKDPVSWGDLATRSYDKTDDETCAVPTDD
ncbi:hypothetical protein ACHAW6_008332 [Cyclotella cf. meneghiniana]